MKVLTFFIFLFLLSSAYGDVNTGNSPQNSPPGLSGTLTKPAEVPITIPESESDLKARREGRTYVVPAPFYSPETALGLNALLFKVFPFDEIKNRDNSSNILAYATYTTKLQFATAVNPTYYWDHGLNLFTGEIGFKNWPDEFYNIGSSSSSNYENYTTQTLYVRPRFYREFFRRWSAGPFYEMQNDVLTVLQPAGLLAAGTIPGSEGTFQSGLGVGIRWDSRDVPFFPTKGALFEGSITQFTKYLGSNYEFARLSLDAHQYFSVVPRNVIAFEEWLRTTAGSVPFQSMSVLGGNQYLRGIYQGRFRDKDLVLGQVEYRFPIYDRLGAALFGGIGEVSDQVNTLDTNHTQSAVGGGLRYFLDVHEQLNVRVDFGMSPSGDGVYICAGEAL